VVFERKIKVVLKSDLTGETLDTIKFSKKEFETLLKKAKFLNMTVEELFGFALNKALE